MAQVSNAASPSPNFVAEPHSNTNSIQRAQTHACMPMYVRTLSELRIDYIRTRPFHALQAPPSFSSWFRSPSAPRPFRLGSRVSKHHPEKSPPTHLARILIYIQVIHNENVIRRSLSLLYFPFHVPYSHAVLSIWSLSSLSSLSSPSSLSLASSSLLQNKKNSSIATLPRRDTHKNQKKPKKPKTPSALSIQMSLQTPTPPPLLPLSLILLLVLLIASTVPTIHALPLPQPQPWQYDPHPGSSVTNVLYPNPPASHKPPPSPTPSSQPDSAPTSSPDGTPDTGTEEQFGIVHTDTTSSNPPPWAGPAGSAPGFRWIVPDRQGQGGVRPLSLSEVMAGFETS